MTDPQPTASRQIPAPLQRVREFANTLDVEAGTDELQLAGPDTVANAQHARHWLAAHDLWPAGGPDLTPDAHARLVRFRDALRALLKANHDGGAAPEEARDQWASLTGGAALRVNLDPDGSARLVPAAAGVDGVIAAIAAAAYDAMAAGTWARLKICAADTCQWAFYDTSRNRSGTWCSMAVCGNRAKVRKYQARRKERDADA